MLTNPECQAAAHKEIDAVVGRGRLPDYNDRDNLPYISAIVTEVLRWKPTTPMGTLRLALSSDLAHVLQPSPITSSKMRNTVDGGSRPTPSSSRTPGPFCTTLRCIRTQRRSTLNGTSCDPRTDLGL
jgi:hypothetical protein